MSVEDGSDLPPAEGLLHEPVCILGKGHFIDGADHDAVTHVEISVALVEPGVKRIGEAQVEVVAAFAEGGAQVIDGMRPRVVGGDRQAMVQEVLALHPDVESVVVGITVAAAEVDVRELAIQPGGGHDHGGVESAEDDARAQRIDVADRILVQAARAGILEGKHRVAHHFVLKRQAVELRVRGLDVRIDGTQAGAQQGRGSTGRSQRSKVAGAESNRSGDIARRAQREHGIVGRILDHVEGHVAKIAFVRNAVAAAEAGLSVSKGIEGKADARSEVAPARLPQLVGGNGGRGGYETIGDLLEQVASRSEKEIGIKAADTVMLHAIVLPAHTHIECKSGKYLPGILRVGGAIVEVVVAFKARRIDRQGNQAGWRCDRLIRDRINHTRELALRVYRSLELEDGSVHQALQA